MSGEGEFAMWLAIGGIGVAFWVMMAPIFKAAATRIAGKGGDPARLEELEHRLAELEVRALTSGEVEAQFSRFDELEGRLEFAERMLTSHHEAVTAPERPGGAAG
jgi:hypothetical protein